MKKNKGISLIVLVITIIVIIILAGAVILSLANNNPIESANEATFKTNVAEYNSELAMAIANEYLQDNSFDSATFDAGVWDGTGNGTGTIKEYITSMSEVDAAKYEIQSSKLVYVGSDQTEIDMLVDLGIESGSITPPVVIELGVNVIATENATVNGQAATYSNPIIPTGFKAINDGAIWPTDWNEGLVIEDTSGNQFVWVPVNETDVTYTKWCTTNIPYTNAPDDELPDEVTSELSQITTYGGFYIGRYEAGNSSNVLVSKKNMAVWNYINYTNSKEKAELMYNTAEMKSGILTGTQWDTAMKWIQNSGISVINSTTWGNHSNSVNPANVAGYGGLQITGYSEYWKVNNIYDLAGNAWEWSNEKYSTYDYIIRGGVYGSSGSAGPVACRGNNSSTFTHESVSFRVVLYIL
ncbi:MAG: hypothetical protein PHD15_03190 [Clostridia bacterium]|nr:hypothetical protein [Clostridia bacterium]MDD4386746.1 hypothetical protein [Clostridia bacterium]